MACSIFVNVWIYIVFRFCEKLLHWKNWSPKSVLFFLFQLISLAYCKFHKLRETSIYLKLFLLFLCFLTFVSYSSFFLRSTFSYSCLHSSSSLASVYSFSYSHATGLYPDIFFKHWVSWPFISASISASTSAALQHQVHVPLAQTTRAKPQVGR